MSDSNCPVKVVNTITTTPSGTASLKIRTKPSTDFNTATQTQAWTTTFIWDYVRNQDENINFPLGSATVSCVDTTVTMAVGTISMTVVQKTFEATVTWTPASGVFTSGKCTFSVTGYTLTDTYDFTVYPITIKDLAGTWLETSKTVLASVLTPYSYQLE